MFVVLLVEKIQQAGCQAIWQVRQVVQGLAEQFDFVRTLNVHVPVSRGFHGLWKYLELQTEYRPFDQLVNLRLGYRYWRDEALSVSEFHQVPVDPKDVYYLESAGGDTLVRLRSEHLLRDVRPPGTLLKEFTPLRVPPSPSQP